MSVINNLAGLWYFGRAEVEIHVYDEIKGCRRDFKCSQSLLTSSMGYFSEITKGKSLVCVFCSSIVGRTSEAMSI